MAETPICYGEPLPPVPNKPFLKVDWARVGCPIHGIFAQDTWTGTWVHWMPGTVGCSRSDDCPHCPGKPIQYQGYIAIWNIRKAEYWILQLPDGAARMLAPAIEEFKTLNGVEFRARRVGTKNNGPVVFEFLGRKKNPSPDVIDITFSLERVWGMNLAKWREDNSFGDDRYTVTGKKPSRSQRDDSILGEDNHAGEMQL